MSDIKTVDFHCYPQGDIFSQVKQIKLPAICCGVETKVLHAPFGPDSLASGCHTHMSSYVGIWQNFEVRKYGLLHGVTNQYGVNCTKCNWRNDLATGNQPDGSYICFKCRNGY
jgi:hypothetical protein